MSLRQVRAEVRARVAAHFQHRCAYCRSPVMLFPGSQQLDHIVPRSQGGTDEEENLCYCCPRCNQLKRDRVGVVDPVSRRRTALFHPRRQRWKRHFAWSADYGRIEGVTICGRATVAALDLNHVDLVRARAIWLSAGWHPPRDDHST